MLTDQILLQQQLGKIIADKARREHQPQGRRIALQRLPECVAWTSGREESDGVPSRE